MTKPKEPPMKCSVFLATSMDGYIASEDGSIHWLDEANAGLPDGEDCGFAEFLDSVDYLIMGRKTFEQVVSFGDWPYGEINVIVLTSKPNIIPSSIPKTVSQSSEDIQSLYEQIKNKGAHKLYVDGGTTVNSFLKAGLVDDITLTQVPVFIGNGISLFTDGLLKLKLMASRSWNFGFVQNEFLVLKDWL